MAKLASIFISARYLRALSAAVWIAAFLVTAVCLGIAAHHKVMQSVDVEIGKGLEPYLRLRAHVEDTFAALRAEVTASPCSPAYLDQLRKVAYRPDGLNEFLHAPGGRAQCSVNVGRLSTAIELGAPDFGGEAPGSMRFWIDRELGFIGLPGTRGTIVLRDPFAIVVPRQDEAPVAAPWLASETVMVAADGRWWHRDGTTGVHQRALIAAESGSSVPFRHGALYRTVCDGVHCVTGEVRLAAIAAEHPGTLAIFILLAGFVASWATRMARRFIERYWSFEARFRRNLDGDAVVCVYQPLLRLKDRHIAGCEVLARWRDLDDRIVFPDRFIPLVEKHGLTARLTRLVAERAFAELSRQLPASGRFQVNFNIFPRDLDHVLLLDIYAPFLAQPGRWKLVLEIVENDSVPLERAQAEIEALRAAGVHVYMDDFGCGYANVHTLGALAVDGVKLDRCFAMAPDESVMSKLLGHAIEMVRVAGLEIVVEGVETAERLEELAASPAGVDYVQGYHISRPVDIAGLSRFLHTAGQRPAVRRAAA